MALVREFKNLDQKRGTLHLPAEAKIAAFETDGLSFVQINTYGTPSREMPGKVSQSIQFTEKSAKQLVDILRKTFSID